MEKPAANVSGRRLSVFDLIPLQTSSVWSRSHWVKWEA